MQDLFSTGWLPIFIASLIVVIIQIGLYKDTIKFNFPRSGLLLTLLNAAFFLIPLFFLNYEMKWLTILIPFILGVIIILLSQSMSPKAEIIVALMSFVAVILIFKFVPENPAFILGVFVLGALSASILRLLRAEKFLGNLMASATVLLPIYAGYMWINSIDLPETDISKKFFVMLVITILALIYGFVLNLFSKDNYTSKRIGAIFIAALVLFLVLNNFLLLSLDQVYLVIAGFIFAQVLEVMSIKSDQNIKISYPEALMGFGLILLIGFIVTRLFGIWGLIIVSLCCLATAVSETEKPLNWPAIAVLFFSCKALVHVFIEQTTLNITGLNLNHPYVYVGLIIGLTLPFIALAFAITYKTKFVGFNFLILFILGLITPLMSSYLIHSEASGAMILALSVSSLIVAIGGKIVGTEFDHKITRILSNAMLPLTGLIAIMLLLTQNLIQIGNIAARETRAETFIVVMLVIILMALALLNISKYVPEEFYPEETN